jgi:hypothetical protein
MHGWLQRAPHGGLRITGQVVAILEPSPKRERLVGVVQVSGAAHKQGSNGLWGLS